MRHAQEVVFNIFVLLFTAVYCLGIVARSVVFVYWWVADAWVKERDGEWEEDKPEDAA